jgi:Protein of unknown function (DUF1588)/Protein of unknown function (DUF1592)/Protein of unknown function (DUF1595)/Protein of unknown function (DUF1587)/Protein of unknown function (DUF1585)
MNSKGWVACCSLLALPVVTACQASPGAGTGAAGTSTASAGATNTGGAGSGGSDTPPVFQPLGGPAAIACDPATKGLAGRRIWRLTRAQYERSVSALLGDSSHPAADFNPEPGSAQGFQNDAFALRVRGAEAGQFQAAAHKLAQQAVAGDLARISACAATSLADATCAATLIKDFGRRAFRRPLSDTEQSRYLALFTLGKAKRDAKLGLEVLVEAMLQSPNFLYRSELGAAATGSSVALTEHERAALLSYTFTGGAPDTELAAEADAGALNTPENLEKQARRLLQTPEARPALWELYRQLFEVTSLENAPKDASIFPDFEASRGALEASAKAFTEHVLFDGDARLGSLMTGTQAYVNQQLAPLFGVTAAGSDLSLVTQPGGEHPGLLGHPAVLSVLAARTRTSPVNRGRFVRQRLLCQQIPDPPANVDTQLPALTPGLSARQQLDAKTSGAPCSTCHTQMNPIGFGFERLDGIGRYRAEENGQAIDDSGAITGTRDIDGPFQGLPALAAKLAGSAQVQECIALQGFRYVMGRPESSADACSVVAIRDRFVSSGLDLKELYVSIALSESFGSRKAD